MSGRPAPSEIDVAPLYARRRTDPGQPWRARADWIVSQRIDDADPAEANRLALLDLEGGADGLTLVSGASLASRNRGLASPDALGEVLDRVELDLVALRLDAGAHAPAFAAALVDLVEARRLASANVALDFGFDPVALAAFGDAPDAGTAATLVALAGRAGLAGRPLLCDARPWHEAGAVPARELAIVLATAAALVRRLHEGGASRDVARRAIAVLLPFDADVLVGLAKARAVRRLWAAFEAAYGLEPAPLLLHAETSWRVMTRFDPHTNAMRATAAAYAAGLGGADSVTVLPMTLVGAMPDAAARRLARNTGRVLLDEADLAAVTDPAAGSGAYETLTEDLCAGAWALFQEIERAGGIEAALRDGSIARAVAGDAVRRRQAAEHYEHGIVGTSLFPQIGDGEVVEPRNARPLDPLLPIERRRDAETFEDLRATAARAAVRPAVFLATLGEPAEFGARANRAADLFATVGIATEPPPLVARDVAALVAAAKSSGSGTACLCGSDAAYAAGGAAAVEALGAAGFAVLVLGSTIEGATTLMPGGAEALPVLRRTLEDLLGS